MKKLTYAIIAAAALSFSSCEKFLDTENYTKANTGNYPASLRDAQQVLTGIYNNLSIATANPQFSFFYISELASDDRLGGGGDNDFVMQAEDLLMNYNQSMLAQFWADRYQGIFRANSAIATLDNCKGYESEDQKKQMKGEAYFLRALYYYELASLFGNVPLVIKTDPVNLPKASADEEWGQIMQDLKTAIELMPAKPAKSGWVGEGHADKWCAEALMARAFLFYTGYYQKESVTLPEGGTISRADVIAWIDDCVNNSGYRLVTSDYRNLWAYTNRLTVNDYTYTKGQNLKWVEDDNGINPESMFAIKFNRFASWDETSTIGYANQYALHFGIRGGQDLDNSFPFGQGWGAGPVAPNLWDDWSAAEPTDPRRRASICVIPEELPKYKKGGWSDFVQETDYYAKKTAPISCKSSAGAGYRSTFEYEMYPGFTEDNYQLGNIHDLVLIRFADVLLMQSELKKDAAGMNRVRARVGLGPVAYSDEALRRERRWELCFEGIRWNDIRRWRIAEQALAKQINQPTYHAAKPDKNGQQGPGYVERYKTTGGFFKIPESQIALSNGVLEQNPGWDASANYTGWKETGR
ncbi:RagB/SusD family nutrient uptake outer membrane protein [Arcticibacter sp. MXS-1]|uniref:RagB/SusD family nutrient uptake outer membrane protein n=1 Tax=Arcticibacter sp. MXS-1 TaxID=3341726 RepID=UPI0035A910EA